jgi:hypothetical protein
MHRRTFLTTAAATATTLTFPSLDFHGSLTA